MTDTPYTLTEYIQNRIDICEAERKLEEIATGESGLTRLFDDVIAELELGE